MDNNIVPFGKYKGQPIEVMAQDHQYIEWIQQQGWLAEKYPQINTLIINNFQAPSETPDHNKIQGMFLDKDFIIKFTKAYCKKIQHLPEIFNNIVELLKEVVSIENPYFEVNGIDVQIVIKGMEYIEIIRRDECRSQYGAYFRIEIKPSLGDDYPAVLRQIRSLKDFKSDSYSNILLINTYSGVGITEDQLIKLFLTQGIIIIFIREII